MATCPSPSDMYLQADQRETLVTPGDFENVRGKLCNDDSGQRKKKDHQKIYSPKLVPMFSARICPPSRFFRMAVDDDRHHC